MKGLPVGMCTFSRLVHGDYRSSCAWVMPPCVVEPRIQSWSHAALHRCVFQVLFVSVNCSLLFKL